MNRPARKPHAVGVPTPTATHKVRFGNQSRPGELEEKLIGRVPRVARLLALAHRVDGMIRSGELKDWAEAARLIGVTRARMTQIEHLMLLAPEIQYALLHSPSSSKSVGPVTERGLRRIVTEVDWREQHSAWRAEMSSPR